MSDFSATDIAFSGFQFVRNHPKVVAAWTGIQLLISALFGGLIVVVGGPAAMLARQMQAERAAGQTPDPAQTMALLHQMGPVYLLVIPFMLIFYPVLYAAMARAALRAEDSRFAFLRLGADEGRQLLLMLLGAVVVLGLYIGWMLLLVVLGVIVGLVAKSAMTMVLVVAVIASLCGWIFLAVRLSLAVPLSFDTRRVNLFGSWGLTRGHFWKLFGAYLLAGVCCLVLSLLVIMVHAILILAMGGGMRGLADIMQPDLSTPARFFTPVRLVMMVISAGAGAVILPGLLQPPMQAYRALRD